MRRVAEILPALNQVSFKKESLLGSFNHVVLRVFLEVQSKIKSLTELGEVWQCSIVSTPAQVSLESRRRFLQASSATLLFGAVSQYLPKISPALDFPDPILTLDLDPPAIAPVHRGEVLVEPLPEPKPKEMLFPENRAWMKPLSLDEIKKTKESIPSLVQAEAKGFRISGSEILDPISDALQNIDVFVHSILKKSGMERYFDWRHYLATIKIETGFDARDSRKGAKGLMQLTQDAIDDVLKEFGEYLPAEFRENPDLRNPKVSIVLGALYLNLSADRIFESYEVYRSYEEARLFKKEGDMKKYAKALSGLTEIDPEKIPQDVYRTEEELLFSAFFTYHSGANGVVRKGFSLMPNSEGMRYVFLPHLVEAYTNGMPASPITRKMQKEQRKRIEQGFGMKTPKRRKMFDPLPGEKSVKKKS